MQYSHSVKHLGYKSTFKNEMFGALYQYLTSAFTDPHFYPE